MSPCSPRNDGFTLIEMAVAILIIGLLTGAAIMMSVPILRTADQLQTRQKMENIARAVDGYAIRNYRVPCPAAPDASIGNSPFGFETGSGPGGNAVPRDCGTDAKGWEGIVPFRTLNIPEDWIRDSEGHFITYAISPAFSQDATQENLPVHSRCRTIDWFSAGAVYEKNLTDPATGQPPRDLLIPKAPQKARFCCSGAMLGTDLVILDADGQSQISIPRQISGSSYASAQTTFPDPFVANTPIPQDDRATAPVYVLVAHGAHGGAFTGSGRERYAQWFATLAETENANGDRRYFDIPAGARGFDDVVLWRTQDMIFASEGKSCSVP